MLTKLLSLLLVSLLLITALPPASGQENIQLLIAVDEWMSDVFNDESFVEFEAAHPGVEVVVIENGQDSYISSPAYDAEDFLTRIENVMTRADVFFASTISPVGTRAGYYLNLEPLVSADTSLDQADFYPAAWQSFQWDGGIWALPVSFDVNFLVYDPAKFDAAGLAYPTASWGIEDFALAAETLTVRDEEGNVTLPGLISWNSPELLRLLVGRGYYDDNFPANPDFTFPELTEAVTRWQALVESGVVGVPDGGTGPDTDFAMMLGGAYNLQDWQGVTGKQGVLLPGNYSLPYVNGLAASAGTQHPELAYELIKYLTTDPMLGNRTSGNPARISVAEAELPEDSMIFRQEYDPEIQAFIDEARANALPLSEMRYSEYLGRVITPFPMEDSELSDDPEIFLQELETQALEHIQLATDRRNATTLTIMPPAALPELAPGEVAINFGLFMNISPMPNREQWDAFAAEFAANDPEVGYVLLDPTFGGMEHPGDKYDCFYSEGWYADGNPAEKLLSLDPFTAVDSTFDAADFVPGALDSFRDDEGQTWAFPILITPQVLGYNTVKFDEAGIPYPENGWTVSEFIEALEMLKDNTSGDPFVNGDWSHSYIYMLIAAFGGLPFDPSAPEMNVNLTDPVNVEAIRQVLDLAKNGYISYSEMATMGGGGSGTNLTPEGPGIQTQTMMDIEWNFNNEEAEAEIPEEFRNPYQYVTYPQGSTYTPVGYAVKGGYITQLAQSPEACYRFISAISQRPDLFSGMPARYSTIEQITEPRGDLFRQFSTMMGQPSAVIINSQWNSTAGYVANYVIGRAFDRYVLEEADLVTELEEAQRIVTDITTCMAPIEAQALDPATATQEDYERQFDEQRACAINVDPDLVELFPEFD